MKRWPLSLGALAAVAIGVAVALVAAGVFDDGDSEATPGHSDEAKELAIEAAIAEMVAIGAYEGNIVIRRVEEVVWPDSCLGVEQEGVACAQVITPGYIVYLSDVSDYEFHTDTRGNAVLAAGE